MSKNFYGFAVRPADPSSWWRRVCWVTPALSVSGDLPGNRTEALTQLRYWESEGVTDYFDMRGEADDTAFISKHSNIETHWFGVDDNGTPRSDVWFASLTERAGRILLDPNRKILVGCHLGVNRSSSALFAIMIHDGHDYLEALNLIRDARPIASMMYAPDAASWHQRSLGESPSTVFEKRGEVVGWLHDNYLDVSWVIRNIGNRLAS